MSIVRASWVDCLYGDTGSTKTSRLGDAAEYFFEKTGKSSRLISTDNAGFGPIESLVDVGLLVAYRVNPNRPYLIGDLSKLSKGYWPKDLNDPFSELVPSDLSDAACVMFDGITTICEMMLQVHMRSIKVVNGRMETAGVRVPEMPSDCFVSSGPDYAMRFTGRSDYLGVQDRIQEFIRNTSMLPVPVVWTALEAKGMDEDKKPTYGPQFIGRALTGVCGPWFANLIHMDFRNIETDIPDPDNAAIKLKVIQPRPYMYLRKHIDPFDQLKVPYPAKVRAPRDLHAEVPAIMRPRLDELYRFLDSLHEKDRQQKKEHLHVKSV